MIHSELRADVYVSAMLPITPTFALPEGMLPLWQPTTATLLSGAKDAILVDALLTISQAEDLADWIETIGKRLTTIYITHGHGDHAFGLPILLRRFPAAQAVATEPVVEHLRAQSSDPSWEQHFPNQIEWPQPLPGVIEGTSLDLDGRRVDIVKAGQGDMVDSTFVHVPDLDLVVAGDIVYNDVHQYLIEAHTEETRREWTDGIRAIAELNPASVVCGHKRPGAVDSAADLEATIRYIDFFGEALSEAVSAEDLFARLIKAYPHRVNPYMAWWSASSAFTASRQPQLVLHNQQF